MTDRERIAYTMSRVRSSGSAMERRFGSALWKAGLRYRKQHPVFGKPDFALVGLRVAIFCDSDFWHGYRWGEKRRREHKSNQAYWFAKIERNRKRDRLVNRTLRREGWRVVRFWEHDLKADLARCVEKVLAVARASGAGRTAGSGAISKSGEGSGLIASQNPP